MLKYYCDHCRLLYSSEVECTICGYVVENKIWIEVQQHNNKSHRGE